MAELITPDQVPRWIPGELTLDSTALAWDGIALKGYRYKSLDVAIPTMRDHMLVRYKGEPANMSRRSGGPWCTHRVQPGAVSILTRAEQSQWKWDHPIDVSHIYLANAALASVAGEVFERDIQDVEMDDHVSSKDMVLTALMAAFESELDTGGLGGRLYVESLKNQLCIHLLRRYANVVFRENRCRGRLSAAQRRLLEDYVEENIERNISLEDLAAIAQLSVSTLIRRVHAEFDCPPHAYVLRRRIERAKSLLTSSRDVPLKVVAAESGFADQSHMTRLFRRVLNVTPVEYRCSILGH
jgi:AraC family transcriptional regulator